MFPAITRGRPVWPVSEKRPDLAVLVTDDGSRSLICTETGNTFHSVAGAYNETKHTYFTNSGVRDHWARQSHANILEIGFGTGLGMLVTVDEAISLGKSLHFVSLEIDWLSAEILAELNFADLLNNPSIVDSFLEFRNSAGPCCVSAQSSIRDYVWRPDSEICVEIHVCDAKDWLSQRRDVRFEAIYFDPFSIDADPKLWDPEIFRRISGILALDGRLVTYSCARVVREAMANAGFNPQRVPGPPQGKRESLIATL